MADSVIGTGTVQSCALQCTGGQYAAKRALQATPRLTHMHGTAKVYDEIADTRDQLDPRLQRLNRQRTGEKLEVPQQPAFFPYPPPCRVVATSPFSCLTIPHAASMPNLYLHCFSSHPLPPKQRAAPSGSSAIAPLAESTRTTLAPHALA